MSQAAIKQKQVLVDKLKEKIKSASVMLVSDYRGLTVKELTELRKILLSQEAEYKIYKNTLITRAVAAAGYDALGEQLAGPTALLLGYQDPLKPLKSFVEFVKEIEKGQIKAGVVEKAVLNAKQIGEIAQLPPRQVLLSKVAGGLQAPVCGLVNVLAGALRKLLYALNAVKEKKGGETNDQG